MSQPNNDHYAFLFSCLQHKNGPKIDFAEVAKDCNIVTKEAAAKRYSRLYKAFQESSMTSNQDEAGGADSGPQDAPASPAKRGRKRKTATTARTTTTKRSKTAYTKGKKKIEEQEEDSDKNSDYKDADDGVVDSEN